jgi:hypothetical protein
LSFDASDISEAEPKEIIRIYWTSWKISSTIGRTDGEEVPIGNRHLQETGSGIWDVQKAG